MNPLFIPDGIFPDFRRVTPSLLRERGIRFIFSDIDNTLATYDDPLPPPDVLAWRTSMEEAGIAVILVSNNNAARVDSFAEALGTRAYPKAGKPGKRTMLRALADAGAKPEESLCLGDQLLTDCAAGRRCGMTVFLVPPIADRTTLFWRVKRRLERPHIRAYLAAHPDTDTAGNGWDVWRLT